MNRILTPLLLGTLVAPAFAQTPSDTERRIAELERKLAAVLKAEGTTESGKVKLMNQAEVERKTDRVGLKGFYEDGYFVLGQSADGAFKIWMDNRVNLDAAFYSGSKNRMADGVTARRARLGLKATLWQDWVAEVDYDFADNETAIKDLWMGYAGWKNSILRIGNHKQPFGFDTVTSSKNTWFMERAYPDAINPDRRPGISYAMWGERWQAAAGIFSQEFNKEASGVDQGWGYAARATFAPVMLSPTKVIHLGVGYTQRTPDAAVGSGTPLPALVYDFTLDARPETKVARTKFLSAKFDQVKHLAQTGLEFAGVWGPFSWQSEYQKVDVARRSGFPTKLDHTFKTYYGQVSWFLTGGSRSYSPSEAEFDRVYPTGKYGAWELVARVSNMDLNDLTATDAIKGGQAKNMTLGLTWHINPNYKAMLNYTKVDHDDYAKPTKSTFGNYTNDDFSFVSIRFQFCF